ncbi:hypothetical protein A3F65_01285 [Candidatus Saccharibacteria bacterium RIFCSPHIGHO2_12_FULL_47_16b]|nr:MAG: hypothetical protein A3F65_01285 [Candidatus Saccharibacteria bacterium RIFCSPHIGHO2_12_FULL_47_16b]
MDWLKDHKIWLGVIVLFILVIVAANAVGGGKKTTNTQINQQSASEAKPKQQKPQPVFNIPSLIGKNIDQIRETLGAPADGSRSDPTAEQSQFGLDEWDNTFKKEGIELLVTFNPATRVVIDFFVSTDDPSGATEDKDRLIEISGLSENADNYRVEFVRTIKDPNSFTGIKAIPK